MNSPTDNNGQGGISIGIHPNGRLKKFGVYTKEYGTKCIEHPISGIKFENFQIPYWEETISLVKKAHQHFYGVKTIGWDVAITPDGPKLIEGNIDWNFPMAQMANGPLKRRWKEML